MISALVSSLWWFALALTLAAVAYLLLVIGSVVAFWPVTRFGGDHKRPSITLLKPLCGLEDGLEEALESFLSQEVQSSVRFVFGVSDASDPALALARQVAGRFPQVSAEFVANPEVHGPNPKVSNLINMAALGLDDVVGISDSDIVLFSGSLQRAVDALAPPGIGAVTALYRSKPGIAGDKWRQFGALFLDYWFLPMALLHARLAPLSVTYGPLTLVKRDVLETAGGLEALADHLSDDAELGKRVRASGYAVAFTPDVAETLVNDASHAELFDHELRWSRTVRGLDPLGFVASVVSHPGPLTLLLLLRPGWIAVAGILAPVLLRWLLVVIVSSKFGRADNLPRPGLFTLWLRDCYCFAVWAKAFGASKVAWRGQRLAVSQGDILAS